MTLKRLKIIKYWYVCILQVPLNPAQTMLTPRSDLLRPRSSHFTERPLAENIFTTNVLVLVLVHIHYQHHGGTIAGLLEVHPN